MFLASTPSRFNAANTRFIAAEFSESAAPAVLACVVTPAETMPESGAAFASPWPTTVRVCGGALSAAAGKAKIPARHAAASDLRNVMMVVLPFGHRDARRAARPKCG